MQSLEQKLFESLSKACGIRRVLSFLSQGVDIAATEMANIICTSQDGVCV